jgi:hypothetical protein
MPAVVALDHPGRFVLLARLSGAVAGRGSVAFAHSVCFTPFSSISWETLVRQVELSRWGASSLWTLASSSPGVRQAVRHRQETPTKHADRTRVLKCTILAVAHVLGLSPLQHCVEPRLEHTVFYELDNSSAPLCLLPFQKRRPSSLGCIVVIVRLSSSRSIFPGSTHPARSCSASAW